MVEWSAAQSSMVKLWLPDQLSTEALLKAHQPLKVQKPLAQFLPQQQTTRLHLFLPATLETTELNF